MARFNLEDAASKVYSKAEEIYKGSEINSDTLARVADEYFDKKYSPKQIQAIKDYFVEQEKTFYEMFDDNEDVIEYYEESKDIKTDLNIEPGSDEEYQLDNILDTDYDLVWDSLDDSEKDEYMSVAKSIRVIGPDEALIDVIDDINNKAKENKLEKDILLYAYTNILSTNKEMKTEGLYDSCYKTNDREELKELALNAIYVAHDDVAILNELLDRLSEDEKIEYLQDLMKFKKAPYDFVANNYTNIPIELLREIALDAIYVANNDEAIQKEINDRKVGENYTKTESRVNRVLHKGDRFENDNGVVITIVDVNDQNQVTYKYDNGDSRCFKMDSVNNMLINNGYHIVEESKEIKTEDVINPPNGEDISSTFKNYEAFKNNFGKLIIVKDKYDKTYKVYNPERQEQNDYIYFSDNKDNINGWLYGAVMCNMGAFKQLKTESKKYNVYATYGGDGVYNSKLVDTVDSEEQAVDRVAELQATGVGASYEEVEDKNEEYVELEESNQNGKEVPYDNTTVKICPRCGKEYTNYPALSRRDNKTYICPDCGVAEALEDFYGKKTESKDAIYVIGLSNHSLRAITASTKDGTEEEMYDAYVKEIFNDEDKEDKNKVAYSTTINLKDAQRFDKLTAQHFAKEIEETGKWKTVVATGLTAKNESINLEQDFYKNHFKPEDIKIVPKTGYNSYKGEDIKNCYLLTVTLGNLPDEDFLKLRDNGDTYKVLKIDGWQIKDFLTKEQAESFIGKTYNKDTIKEDVRKELNEIFYTNSCNGYYTRDYDNDYEELQSLEEDNVITDQDKEIIDTINKFITKLQTKFNVSVIGSYNDNAMSFKIDGELLAILDAINYLKDNLSMYNDLFDFTLSDKEDTGVVCTLIKK